ncbi:family 1 glycosylhydrolase, partial [Alicyclobacillus fastidiosus]
AGGYQGEIGITLNFTWVDSASNRPEDVAAARREDGFANRWFIEPLMKRQYPSDMVEWVEGRIGALDFIEPGDLESIASTIDFLGINFYSRNVVQAGAGNAHLESQVVQPSADRVTDMGWEIHPESLYRLLTWLKSEYTADLPLVITENGAAFRDELVDGEVQDVDRVNYVADHLEAAKRFIDEGGPLKGYYLWSFMDNFEWAFGYSKRFGMVYVDYATQVRTVKASGKWYSGQIAHHRAANVR